MNIAMNFSKNHFVGFLAGVTVSAAGFYLYKKNQPKIENFLRSQGIELPHSDEADYKEMTLEKLMENKENLEDLIAEKEQQ